MRVLVAGAAGAIGRPLVPRLLAAGHQVIGTTRREERAASLREAGAEAIVCDLLHPTEAHEAVRQARPDVVVDELTSLPQEDFDLRRKDVYVANDRIRREGTGALIEAAVAAGVRRYVLQSVAFLYAPEGDWVKDEDARPWTDAPAPFGGAVRVLVANERKLADAPLEGVVLRYGFFYGPGTHYAPDGAIAAQVRKRMFPVVGGGAGTFSFVHVADAASATVAAVERGAPGIYNVVDDEPAPLRAWLPVYAEALGAKRPLRAPAWLARLVAGPYVAASATIFRGASDAKAKRELGWTPAVPSWREGFRAYRDSDPATSAVG